MGDDIVGPDTRPRGAGAVDRGDDLDATFVSYGLDPEPSGAEGVRHLHVAEELPVKIFCLGIEHTEHAFDRRIDELRLINPVDIAGLDALQGSDESVKLLSVGRRLLGARLDHRVRPCHYRTQRQARRYA